MFTFLVAVYSLCLPVCRDVCLSPTLFLSGWLSVSLSLTLSLPVSLSRCLSLSVFLCAVCIYTSFAAELINCLTRYMWQATYAHWRLSCWSFASLLKRNCLFPQACWKGSSRKSKGWGWTGSPGRGCVPGSRLSRIIRQHSLCLGPGPCVSERSLLWGVLGLGWGASHCSYTGRQWVPGTMYSPLQPLSYPFFFIACTAFFRPRRPLWTEPHPTELPFFFLQPMQLSLDPRDPSGQSPTSLNYPFFFLQPTQLSLNPTLRDHFGQPAQL